MAPTHWKKLMNEKERDIAIAAVFAAMDVAERVQHSLQHHHTLTKTDRSPVTVADFAVQAIVCKLLHDAFPAIPIVGEEEAGELREQKNDAVMQRIVEILRPLNAGMTPAAVCDWVARGGAQTADRFWTLDPIDGTKGFLRGEQYVVALALIADGRVELGVLGCPNLALAQFDGPAGCLFVARRGEGVTVVMRDARSLAVKVSQNHDPAASRLVESYESGHSDQELQDCVASALEVQLQRRQLDSQAKYGLVAAGEAEIYLRIPNRKTWDYKEKIWDHAAGALIVEEAGGRVSDIHGNPLDFNHGRLLSANSGILATNGRNHDRVLAAIKNCL